MILYTNLIVFTTLHIKSNLKYHSKVVLSRTTVQGHRDITNECKFKEKLHKNVVLSRF